MLKRVKHYSGVTLVRFDVSESSYTRRWEWWLETTVSLRCLGKIFGLANIWRLSTASNHCAPLHRLFHLINDVYQRSRCWCTLTESSLQDYRLHSCRRTHSRIHVQAETNAHANVHHGFINITRLFRFV